MEPICEQVFPGNSIDAISYKTFIRDNDIKKGTIVADKGFPPSAIKDDLINDRIFTPKNLKSDTSSRKKVDYVLVAPTV